MSFPIWTPAYIGIGSNLHDPKSQVEHGIEALTSLTRSCLVAHSGLYRSAPLGPPGQPFYVNAVAGLLTQLDAPTLLNELKGLERKFGRTEPIVKWGPRIIDFDLLALGAMQVDRADLRVPHPEIAARVFVIVPLMEIAPHLDIPGIGRVDELAERVDKNSLERL